MRVSDIFLAVPQVVLAIAIAQTLGPSLPNVILALSVTYWPWFARLVYAETRALKNEAFIEAAVALGASPLAAHRAARAAERRLAHHRAHLDRHGLHDPHRRRARLPRPRAAAAGARVGPDDRGVARVPARGVVVCAGAGPRHLPHRDGLQPAGRRPARRARSAAAARAGPRAMAELLAVRGAARRVRHRRRRGAGARRGQPRRSGRARSWGWSARAAAARPRWRAPSSASCPPGAPGSAAARSASRAGPPRARTRAVVNDEVRGRAHHLHPARPLRSFSPAVPRRRPDHGTDEVEVAAVAPARRARALARCSPLPAGAAHRADRRRRAGHAARGADSRAGARARSGCRTSSPAASASA